MNFYEINPAASGASDEKIVAENGSTYTHKTNPVQCALLLEEIE